jgi:hypothetical protein
MQEIRSIPFRKIHIEFHVKFYVELQHFTCENSHFICEIYCFHINFEISVSYILSHLKLKDHNVKINFTWETIILFVNLEHMHACGIIMWNFRKGRTCKIEVVVFYYAMYKQYIHMCYLPSPKGEGHFQDRGTVFLIRTDDAGK